MDYPGADGATLHYDVSGTGSPLIVLAGGAGRHPAYLGDLAGLDEEHTLVLPHLRGVGRSQDVPLTSRWDQAADVDALRATLGLERAVVVGHSAGTRLAIAYAAAHAERVEALVLITPVVEYLVDVPTDAPAIAAARMAEPAFAAASAAWEAGPAELTDDAFNAWQLACAPFCYARWDATTAEHARTGGRYHLAANRAFTSGDGPADLVDRLRSLDAPVLVVAGRQDAVSGLAPVLAATRIFRHGRCVVLDDCGHMPWVEQPEAFRDTMAGSLSALPGCSIGGSPG